MKFWTGLGNIPEGGGAVHFNYVIASLRYVIFPCSAAILTHKSHVIHVDAHEAFTVHNIYLTLYLYWAMQSVHNNIIVVPPSIDYSFDWL